jgi:hypothetical protein
MSSSLCSAFDATGCSLGATRNATSGSLNAVFDTAGCRLGPPLDRSLNFHNHASSAAFWRFGRAI